jgi:predicted lipoprotein with Yx(FWY)xxD motif
MHMRTRSILGLALSVVVAACGDDGGSAAPDARPAIDGALAVDAAPAALTLSSAGTLGARLVDKDGKSLYFFANDTPGAGASACPAPCAMWPAFDIQSPTVGDGLTATDFSRFDKGGGVFQATWKGRPLYYFANDTTAGATGGEATAGRWFVARAYNLFFAASAAVTPAGGAAANAPFFTNGAGRSLYITTKDTPAAGATPPVVGCTGGCATTWPLWEKPAALTTVIVPSTVTATDLASFTVDAKQQFTYKGYPMYFFGADDAPGKVAGAAVDTWHAVAVGFTGTL